MTFIKYLLISPKSTRLYIVDLSFSGTVIQYATLAGILGFTVHSSFFLSCHTYLIPNPTLCVSRVYSVLCSPSQSYLRSNEHCHLSLLWGSSTVLYPMLLFPTQPTDWDSHLKIIFYTSFKIYLEQDRVKIWS